MQPRTLYITQSDRERLERMILFSELFKETDKKNIRKLNFEVSQGCVVPDGQLPCDVVTINSQVDVHDLESGRDQSICLVFPEEADERRHKISILAPLGTALLGCKVGDLIHIRSGSGIQKLIIKNAKPITG